MDRIWIQDEHFARLQRLGAAGGVTYAVALMNQARANARMRMTCLVYPARKMQQVEARITLEGRRNQQAIGTAIDIFEPSTILDRAAEGGKTKIIEPQHHEPFGIPGDGEAFVKWQREIAQGFSLRRER